MVGRQPQVANRPVAAEGMRGDADRPDARRLRVARAIDLPVTDPDNLLCRTVDRRGYAVALAQVLDGDVAPYGAQPGAGDEACEGAGCAGDAAGASRAGGARGPGRTGG